MILDNQIGLIGDAIGTIPVMIALSRQHGGGLKVRMAHEAQWIFDFIPKKYKIVLTDEEPELALDLTRAFSIAMQGQQLHMTQAHFAVLGLPVPPLPIRPEFEVPSTETPAFDVILAPFSRSLPEHQKWPQEKWQQLVNENPNINFCLIGTTKHDDINFINGDNVQKLFDQPWLYVMNVMRNAKVVLSVVSGPSHICYALAIPNLLMVNQGNWGKNPTGDYLDSYIPEISTKEVQARLLRYL